MPVLSFTNADVLQTTKVKPGQYGAIVCSIEQKASKEKTSTHFFTSFRIIEGEYEGKELQIIANTKTNNPSLLAGFGYMVPTTVFMDINEAITGQKKAAGELDTDDLLDKPLDIIVTLESVDGDLINVVKGFRTHNTASDDIPF